MEVVKQLCDALQYNSLNDVAYFRLGQNALKVRRFDLAVRFFNLCLSIDLNNPEALLILSKIHQMNGDQNLSNQLQLKANEIKKSTDLSK